MYIKQLNCGGVHNGGNIEDTTILNTMLQDDLDEGKDSVYLIQEPWYEKKSKRKRTPLHPDWLCIMESEGRTAIYHPKHLPIVKVNHLCCKDMTVAMITPKNENPIYLISLYIDREIGLWPPDFFRKAVKEINNKKRTAIVSMDANAEHYRWSGRRLSRNEGERLDHYFQNNDINVQNKPTRKNFTYEKTRHVKEENKDYVIQTWIDVTCTLGNHTIVKNWRRGDIKLADHYLIECEADLGTYDKHKTFKVDKAKVNFELSLNEHINYDSIPEKLNYDTIKHMANILEKAIRESINNNKQEITDKKQFYVQKIWTDNMSLLRNEKQVLRKAKIRAIENKEPTEKIEKITANLNTVSKKLHRSVLRARREDNRIKLENMKGSKDIAELWKRSNSRPDAKINQIKNSQGILSETPLEALANLAMAHNINCQEINIQDHPELHPDYVFKVNYEYPETDYSTGKVVEKKNLTNKFFDKEKVKSLIQTFGPNKM